MLNREKILSKTIILILLFTSSSLLQATTLPIANDSLAHATKLFEDKNYKEALPYFEKILKDNPEDKNINYYYGACLIEEGVYTESTNIALLNALSGNTPNKVMYYIGKFFHHKELWNSALKYYNRFKNYASASEKENLDIQELIDFCYQKINPAGINPPDSLNVPDTLIFQSDTIKKEVVEVEIEIEKSEINIVESDSITEPILKPVIAPIAKKTESINFQVNNDFSYTRVNQFKTDSARSLFTKGKETDLRLNKLLILSDSLRIKYENSMDKENIAHKIIEAEKESLLLKSERDQLFFQARELENSYWRKASLEEKVAFKKILGEIEAKEFRNKEKTVSEEEVFVDVPIVTAPEFFTNNRDRKLEEPKKQEEANVVYKVQIGAYSRGLPGYVDRLFKKLSLIRKIDKYTDDRGVVVYTTGNLTNFDDAIQMQKQVRQEGIKDAFVVAYKDEKRISIKEAKKLTQ